jgi:glycosyltransferase XagB
LAPDRARLQDRYDAVERHFRARLLDRAVNSLERYDPQFSARRVVTRAQAAVLATLALGAIVAIISAPGTAATVASDIMAGWFLSNAMFRALLFAAGATTRRGFTAPPLADAALPIYTILVPLYREAEVAPRLIDALKALDYPPDRLDIKLIVEADDAETVAAFSALDLDERFHLLRVPEGGPRTKPRACNYAMPFARGSLLVIYDAEDRPEPDQLRKAAAIFADSPPGIACLQARLNFYNARENIQTAGIMAQTPLELSALCFV